MANNNPRMGFEWDGKLLNYNRLAALGIAQGILKIGGERIKREMQQEIKAAGRVDTGELLNSFVLDYGVTAIGPEVTVRSTSPHALWVDKGTGIYGPKGTPITRPGGGAMKFNPGRRNSGSATAGVGRRAKTTSFGKSGQFSGTAYATAVSGQEGIQFVAKVRARMGISWFLFSG